MNITHALTTLVNVSRRVAVRLSQPIRTRQLFSNGFNQTWRFARMVCVAGIVVAGCQGGSSGRGTLVTDNLPNPSADGAVLSGAVMGGRQPMAGSLIFVYAAKTTAGTDAVQIGTAKSDTKGRFSITAFDTAPTNGDLIYMVSVGGDAGGGANAPATLLSVIGKATVTGTGAAQTISVTHPQATINEMTTVAALSKLKANITMVPCEKITNNTRLGICPDIQGVAAGWANTVAALDLLVDVKIGDVVAALKTAAAGSNSNKNLLTLNFEASILANCINSNGGKHGDRTACGNLLDAGIASKGTSVAGLTYLGAPVAAGNGPYKVVITPNGKYLYIPNYVAAGSSVSGTGTTITAYSIKPSDGSLTLITGSPFTTTAASASVNGVKDIVVTPDGKFLYAAVDFGQQIWGFSINQSTGALTQLGTNGTVLSLGGTGQLAGNPKAIAIDPAGKFLAIATSSNFGFASIAADGTLSFLGATSGGSIPAKVATNKYSAVTMVATGISTADLAKGGITHFPTATAFMATDNSTTTTPASTSDSTVCDATSFCWPVTAGRNVSAVAMTSDRKFMYAANRNDNTISMYKATIGNVTNPALASNNNTIANAISAVANNNPATQTLSCNAPRALTVSPDNKFLYVPCSGGNTTTTTPANGDIVSVYSISQNTGLLTEVNPTALAFANSTNTGGSVQKPNFLALHPQGRFAYASLQGTTLVAVFAVGMTDTLSAYLPFMNSTAAGDMTALWNLKPPTPVFFPFPSVKPTSLALL
jgi:6-phosphogluconolactonase (cycloisomerase 2 family)